MQTNPRSHHKPLETIKDYETMTRMIVAYTVHRYGSPAIIPEQATLSRFLPGKMMLCGWWSPKACQDNGSNASAVPLNYCVCVSQRHYLTQDYLACQ